MALSKFSDPPPARWAKRPVRSRTQRACGQFRTIQVYPKDRPPLIWQVEPAGDPPSNREGRAVDERAIDRTQNWISDTHAMALYSTLFFFVIVLWVYVPA